MRAPGSEPVDLRAAPDWTALRAALHPDAARLASIAARGDAIDWEWVLDRATAHKVAPLLAARLHASGLATALAPALQARLAATQRDARERADEVAHTLATLTAAFAAAGVPFFIVKGSVLAHEVYGAPHLRRFADIDVVVHAADVARAEAALRALDYRIGGVGEILTRERLDAAAQAHAEHLARTFARRHLGAYSWYAPARRALLPVDLHWQVSPDRLPRDEAELWAQLRPLALGATTVQTFTPAAALLHLAAHATAHLAAGFRLLHLCDLAWALRAYADALPAAWALADRWRMRRHLARVLALVGDLLDCDVPALPGEATPPERPPRLDLGMLLEAPSLARGAWRARLAPELRWGLAFGQLPRNTRTVTAAALARARLVWFRRRHRTA